MAIIPGAAELGDDAELERWMPLLRAMEAGAWLCFCAERDVWYVPVPEIHHDAGRPHREDGPAFASLGTSAWYLRGVEVDEQIVMRPSTQTLRHINEEANAERKRIRIERFGWEKYLRASRAKVIEHVRNEVSQTEESLLQCRDMRVLVCACPSTARVYALEVAPECRTVEQAQDFLSGGRARRIIGAT